MQRLYYLLTLLVFANPAFAALNIQITQGVQAPLPVAIVPFENQAEITTNNDNNLTQVIKNDLQNSGYFAVTPSERLLQFPHSAAEVNQGYFQQVGADNVLVGSVIPQANNQVLVKVSLVNVFQNRMNNTVLWNETYTVDKTALRRLAHHISDQIYAQLTGEKGVFSTRIAYVLVIRRSKEPAEYRLDIADFDGYGPKTILRSNEPVMSPAWSPDGKKIAYVSFEKRHSQIYIHNVATGERELISHYDGINGAPAWSPDGQHLALVLSKSGHPKIYTLDLNTKVLTQVTDGISIDTEPVWTADGKSIYFTSDRGGSPQIYEVNVASKTVKRITFDGNFNASAALSPTGEEMIVLHRDVDGYDIALYNVDSGSLKVLTHSGSNQSPALAPNGRLVMYAARFEDKDVLAITSTDGAVSMRLPAREGNVQEPAWSPFLG
ncbi:MAG: tolB [Gammaproteobacteria bacterium]|jgi:TolB protein|nr:tolB [Gammaproteobacteria bacterium]